MKRSGPTGCKSNLLCPINLQSENVSISFSYHNTVWACMCSYALNLFYGSFSVIISTISFSLLPVDIEVMKYFIFLRGKAC